MENENTMDNENTNAKMEMEVAVSLKSEVADVEVDNLEENEIAAKMDMDELEKSSVPVRVKLDDEVLDKGRPDVKMVNCGCCTMKESTYVLILFTFINIFLFMDQNLLAPNLSIIAEEFNMTEDERDVYLGGYISLGFFAVGGVVAVLVGYAADTVNRKWTFAIVVVLGELSCMMTYWVPSNSTADFWKGLWLTRTCTGVALGGAVPIQYSIFGDFFTVEQRGKAISGINIALGLGAGAGQFVAGYMSPDWRTPFLVVSIPAFVLVAIFVATTKEPQRGGAEKVYDENGELIINDETITWEKFKAIFSKPTAVLIFLQGLPGILPWGVTGVFLNDFLNVEKELDAKDSANVLTIYGLGIAASVVLAGIWFDRVYSKNKIKLPLFAGVTTLTAPWLLLFVIQSEPKTAGIYILLLVPAGFLAGFAGIIVKTLLMNVTLPETRGSAFAIQSLVDELGKGLGPYVVSRIIVAAGSRTSGITISILMWIPCGIMMLLIARYLESDVQKTEAEIKEIHARKMDNEGENTSSILSL